MIRSHLDHWTLAGTGHANAEEMCDRTVRLPSVYSAGHKERNIVTVHNTELTEATVAPP